MTRPNIFFTLVDDLGYGDSSAFNGGLSRKLETLERLSKSSHSM